MARRPERQPWFANVDLDIYGRKGQKLDLLVRELQKSMFIVSDDVGSNRVSLELRAATAAVEPTLLLMARAVQNSHPPRAAFGHAVKSNASPSALRLNLNRIARHFPSRAKCCRPWRTAARHLKYMSMRR